MPILVGSIMAVGVLTYCALIRSILDYAVCSSIQLPNQIWELVLHKFKLGHNAVIATKDICYTKSGGTVNQNTVITVEEILLGLLERDCIPSDRNQSNK